MPVGVPRATTRRGGPRNATARPRFPRRPRLDAPSASAETSQSAPSSASSATASDARDDLPVRVYIEHTDAYQVVYHSNYFKFLWRAREAYVFGGGLASALRDRTGAPFDPTAAGWDHLDVVAIDDCVFARSAVLGDDLLVRTSLRGIGETTLAMRQEVVFADGGELAFAATVTVAPASATGATTTIPREIRGWRAGDGDGGALGLLARDLRIPPPSKGAVVRGPAHLLGRRERRYPRRVRRVPGRASLGRGTVPRIDGRASPRQREQLGRPPLRHRCPRGPR